MSANPIRVGCRRLLLTALGLLAACSSPTSETKAREPADHSQATAVFSKVSDGYSRTKNPDGSFQPETYELVVGKGQVVGGVDEPESAGNASFDDVSRALVKPLALQNFIPSEDSSTTDLLILVYWGTTAVPEEVRPNPETASRENDSMVRLNQMHRNDYDASNGPAQREQSASEAFKAAALKPNPQDPSPSLLLSKVEDTQDARTDSKNAAILGYTDAFVQAPTGDPNLGALRAEIEERRYYVVLLAYDCDMARNQGQHKLLWEAHLSVPARGNDFRGSISAMAMVASKSLGADSHGLVHYDLRTGRVQIGEPKSLGTVP